LEKIPRPFIKIKTASSKMENEKIKITPPVDEGVKNKSIETYAEDMAKVIEGTEGGLIKKIIHEQEIHDLEKKNLSPQSKKNQLFMFVGSLLLFLALGLFIFLSFFKDKVSVVNVPMQAVPIIFTDKNYYQDITKLNSVAIAQSVLNEVRGTDVKTGGVEAIYLTLDGKIVGFRHFIQLIEGNFIAPTAPIIDDNFLLGAVRSATPDINGQDKNLFILLRNQSFIDAFDNTRKWEGKMFNDLHGFFGMRISPETKELLTKDFVDGRISNKNARILYDKSGNIVLMYVFADENSVIVSNSEHAVDEVIFRLNSSQISK